MPNPTTDLRQGADLLRALAHPTRLAILEELAEGAKCVSDIRDLVDVAQANVSQHLIVLRKLQVVDFHQDGKLRCYYITRPTLVKALFRLLAAEHKIIHRSAKVVRREGMKREV